MHKSIIVSATVFLVSGCISAAMFSPTPIAPDFQRINSPEVGVSTSVNVGDTVLKKGDQYTYPALQLTSDLSQSFGIGGVGRYEIPAQKLVATGYNDEHIFYSARGMKHSHSMTGTVSLSGGICVSRTDPDEIKFSSDLVMCGIRVQTIPNLIPTSVTAQDSPSFVQELIGLPDLTGPTEMLGSTVGL